MNSSHPPYFSTAARSLYKCLGENMQQGVAPVLCDFVEASYTHEGAMSSLRLMSVYVD